MNFFISGFIGDSSLYFRCAGLVRRRNQALQALSGIDVQLQKRGRLISNILAIAKRFMSHEAEVLRSVSRLCSQLSDSYDSTEPDPLQAHLTASAALTWQIGRFVGTR